jgi:lipoprotein-anchoring transpeptidase ErfK/SrfK
MYQALSLSLIFAIAATGSSVAQRAGSRAEIVPAPAIIYSSAPGATVQRDADLGGGFIEFLFSGGETAEEPAPTRRRLAYSAPRVTLEAQRPRMAPRFERQEVAYSGRHKAGTIVIDTRERFLYLVGAGGTAVRYGVGVGRPGFEWTGTKRISRKSEWPDWRPPAEMRKRRPDLPVWMAGGPANPLGARAMYLGSSLYRIHGSNEPHTIGQAVSSGCIRMRNEDVVDLYERVRVGTPVVVM